MTACTAASPFEVSPAVAPWIRSAVFSISRTISHGVVRFLVFGDNRIIAGAARFGIAPRRAVQRKNDQNRTAPPHEGNRF